MANEKVIYFTNLMSEGIDEFLDCYAWMKRCTDNINTDINRKEKPKI